MSLSQKSNPPTGVIRYKTGVGVKLAQVDHRPVLITPQGGKIAIDSFLAELWSFAAGKELSEVLAGFHNGQESPELLRIALGCLAEAGLLERNHPVDRADELFLSGELVSVVIVAHNSRAWLSDCLKSLGNQTYQPLDIIVVDNGSSDHTAAWLTKECPEVKIVSCESPVSFAAAINLGLKAARGVWLFLLNPDTHLAHDTIAQLVKVAEANTDCAAVAAKLRFSWAPAFLNGLGNRVDPFTWGTDIGLGHLDLGQFDTLAEVPSACFAAALIPRRIIDQVGLLDEDFPMYYEDSEWSYRARFFGYEILAAPMAVVYHAMGKEELGADRRVISASKLQHVVYGRYRFALKLLDQQRERFVSSYLFTDFLYTVRSLFRMKFASIRAIWAGWWQVLGDYSAIKASRLEFRGKKKLSDPQLFSLQQPMEPALIWHGYPELTWDLITNRYQAMILEGKTRSMPELSKLVNRPHLTIISQDIIDNKIAGPGMRYLEMGKALSRDVSVTIAIPNTPQIEFPELELFSYQADQPKSLRSLVECSHVILVSSFILEKLPFLWETKARVVVDLYDPTVLENLTYYTNEPLSSQVALNQQAIAITNRLTNIGDFFICANERQRDYWLGVLTANGRVTPQNFNADPSLRKLIDVVGIGLHPREPSKEPLLRSLHPQINSDSRIILWGGGIWDWLDPLTLIAAWPAVLSSHPEARLVFMGTRHPNPQVAQHSMVQNAESLASKVGEKDKSIFFFEWISYEDREKLLSEADIGITLHPVHIETHFSLRTRVLDYFWARLPVVITEGDVTSEIIAANHLGEVVPPNDPTAVAEAISRILEKPKASWEKLYSPVLEKYYWDMVVNPLRQYCLEGGYAPDKSTRQAYKSRTGTSPNWGARWARARFILRSEGWSGLIHRIRRFIQWRLSNLR